MIRSPSEIDVSKVEFGPVTLLKSGGKAVNLRYEGRNVMMETPSLSVPYGVNIYDKNGPDKLKYSVDLSLRGADEDEQVRNLQNFLEAFDERMIDAGVENAAKWFKMSNPSREVIKAFYTPLIKMPGLDAQGNPKPYPPTFKLSLRKKKDSDAFETDFYDGTSKPLTQFSKDTPVDQIISKRGQVAAIIQCTGIWFAGGKFGTTWKAVQMRVDSKPEQISGPAFKSDAPDIRAFVAKDLGKKREAPVVESDGEEEDEEVVAAVLPPAKKAAPAPPPKPVANTFEEEEEVAEPVPVPKKMVKKTVVKK
jgi:hypothetical protein